MIDIQMLKEQIYPVVGAICQVHRELGPGLNEACYQEGLEFELTEQGIPFRREDTFHPSYRSKPMQAIFRLDFLCKKTL